MRNNNLGVELQSTLSELCSDLFNTSALDDCNAILQSLAMLADTFPEAQTILGRLFSQIESSGVQTRYSKLSILSSNFLYQQVTARSAISLLAALANDNLRNQQRIVQNITGVILDINLIRFNQARDNMPVSLASSSTLFALTVPVRVTGIYRRWRKRQRELQNCRLPSGIPPSHDGVPMSCYCDDCLGAEQFLSTWQQHFRDLTRWTRDSDQETATRSYSSSLSAEEFFRLFLEDYRILSCTIGDALGHQQERESSDFNKSRKNQSLLYYFVSPEESSAVQPTAVPFNPLFHISAIAIEPVIDARNERLKAVEQTAKNNNGSSYELLEPIGFATQQVILFTSTVVVESCTPLSAKFPNSQNENENLYTDFCTLEEQHGELVQCDSLQDDFCSDESKITAVTRDLLLSMISFCERSDHIPLTVCQQNICPLVHLENVHYELIQPCPVEFNETAPHKLDTRVVVTANLGEQILEIECFPTAAENTFYDSFSTRIPQWKLMGTSETEDNRTLDLICLSDEAIGSLIERCRLCICGNPNAHEELDSIVFLHPRGPDKKLTPNTINDDDEGLAPENAIQACATIRVPLPGLSSAAKRDLGKLETLVSEETYHKFTSETLTSLIAKLSKVVADCNERVSYLSIARDKYLLRAASESHRAAAISRCRHCRDLLIQLGKKIALEGRPLNNLAVISRVKVLRLAKLVRTSVHRVFAHSEAFDPWETPDARVEQLHLDRHIWSSGFPDAAYYQDTERQQRENRKKQQTLSRKLLLQQKQNSKDKIRTKQYKTS